MNIKPYIVALGLYVMTLNGCATIPKSISQVFWD
jgi:starvation-inducible outer membrane lipoprotein